MSNPLRTCIGCTKTDDDPRHVVATADGGSVNWHMGCHVTATNCEVCAAQLDGAKAKTGDELRAHLLTTGPGADQPGWTAPTDTDVTVKSNGKKEAR